MKKACLIALLILNTTFFAQVPNLLKDMSPGSASSVFDGQFYKLNNNDVLYFASTTPSTNTGLWITNGSTAGTILLKPVKQAKSFTPYAGKTFFLNSVPGQNLWFTDGTVAGTDSIAVPTLTSAATLSVVNNLLLFVGNLGNILAPNSGEIWRSDGTVSGTYKLGGSFTSVKAYMIHNNVFYFGAQTAAGGTELWRSDGTLSGTFMLKDIWPGGGSSFNITTSPIMGVSNNNVFFVANDGIVGEELWRTDGTIAGTIFLKDINSGMASSLININNFYQGNNGVYFDATNVPNGRELWFSDGTPANTNLIKDVATGTASIGHGPLFFNGNNAYYYYTLSYFNDVIYKSDGSVAGTTTLNPKSPFTSPAYSNFEFNINSPFMLYNNELYFTVFKEDPGSPFNGYDTLILQKIDLSLSSTSVVSKILANSPFSLGSNKLDQSSFAFFPKIYGNTFIYYYTLSNCLAIYNVVNNNNTLFKAVTGSQAQNILNNPNLSTLSQIGNKLYLPTYYAIDAPSYISLNTDSLYTINNNISFECNITSTTFFKSELYKLNNKYYFLGNELGYGLEFFETDLTTAGTYRIKDIYTGINNFDYTPTNNCSTTFSIMVTANNIYFFGNDGNSGYELWSFVNSPNTPVNIINNSANTDIFIYPNPATNKININSEDPVFSIKLFNSIGEIIYEKKLDTPKTKLEVSTEELSPGVYIINTETKTGNKTKKIIKE